MRTVWLPFVAVMSTKVPPFVPPPGPANHSSEALPSPPVISYPRFFRSVAIRSFSCRVAVFPHLPPLSLRYRCSSGEFGVAFDLKNLRNLSARSQIALPSRCSFCGSSGRPSGTGPPSANASRLRQRFRLPLQPQTWRCLLPTPPHRQTTSPPSHRSRQPLACFVRSRPQNSRPPPPPHPPTDQLAGRFQVIHDSRLNRSYARSLTKFPSY